MGRASGLGGFRIVVREFVNVLIKNRTKRFETIQMKKKKL